MKSRSMLKPWPHYARHELVNNYHLHHFARHVGQSYRSSCLFQWNDVSSAMVKIGTFKAEWYLHQQDKIHLQEFVGRKQNLANPSNSSRFPVAWSYKKASCGHMAILGRPLCKFLECCLMTTLQNFVCCNTLVSFRRSRNSPQIAAWNLSYVHNLSPMQYFSLIYSYVYATPCYNDQIQFTTGVGAQLVPSKLSINEPLATTFLELELEGIKAQVVCIR